MAKNNLNISLGVNVSNLKKGFDEAIKITQQAAGKTEQEMKEMADAIVRQMAKIGSQSTMRGAIRQMENLAGTMSRFGMEGTAAFNEVIKQTGKLKAEQQDLKDLIEASRPDAPFKALGNALQGAAQAFAGINGAMALLGDESEETQKMMVKLQAGLALVEGTKSIDMLGDAFVQIGTVLKTSVLPSLMTLRGALMATGIGALVVGLGMAISYFDDLADSAEQAAEAADKALKFSEQVTALNRMDMQVAINRAKARGASEKEIFDIRKRYHDMEIDLLLEAQGKGADVQSEVFKTRKQFLIDETEFQAQEYQKQQQAIKEQQAKYQAALQAGLSTQREINKELELANQSTWEQQLGELNNWKDEKLKVLNAAGLSSVALELLYAEKLKQVLRQQTSEISALLPKKGITATNTVKTKFEGGLQMPEPRSIPVERVAELNAELAKVQISSEEVNASFQQLAYGGLTDIATAMGTAIATGQNLGQAIGQGLLRAMAGFMKQLGEMFIKAGLAKLAFDSAMISIGGAPLAIAAGTALVAASAAMTAKLQQANKPAQFAEGGLVPAGFSGDSFPALMSSGEAAIPLHNPRAMAKLRDGLQINSGIRIYGKFDGRDIYLANEKYSKDKRR